MRKQEIKKDSIIKFKSLDDLSGKKIILTGTIIGNYKSVRKQYPIECGKADKGAFLVKVENRSGFYVVNDYEVLEKKIAEKL